MIIGKIKVENLKAMVRSGEIVPFEGFYKQLASKVFNAGLPSNARADSVTKELEAVANDNVAKNVKNELIRTIVREEMRHLHRGKKLEYVELYADINRAEPVAETNTGSRKYVVVGVPVYAYVKVRSPESDRAVSYGYIVDVVIVFENDIYRGFTLFLPRYIVSALGLPVTPSEVNMRVPSGLYTGFVPLDNKYLVVNRPVGVISIFRTGASKVDSFVEPGLALRYADYGYKKILKFESSSLLEKRDMRVVPLSKDGKPIIVMGYLGGVPTLKVGITRPDSGDIYKTYVVFAEPYAKELRTSENLVKLFTEYIVRHSGSIDSAYYSYYRSEIAMPIYIESTGKRASVKGRLTRDIVARGMPAIFVSPDFSVGFVGIVNPSTRELLAVVGGDLVEGVPYYIYYIPDMSKQSEWRKMVSLVYVAKLKFKEDKETGKKYVAGAVASYTTTGGVKLNKFPVKGLPISRRVTIADAIAETIRAYSTVKPFEFVIYEPPKDPTLSRNGGDYGFWTIYTPIAPDKYQVTYDTTAEFDFNPCTGQFDSNYNGECTPKVIGFDELKREIAKALSFENALLRVRWDRRWIEVIIPR